MSSNSIPGLPPVRYHVHDASRLFHPVPFGFVTERMRDEILAERALILSRTPERLQAAQRTAFSRYDPARRADAFRDLLRLFLCAQADTATACR